MSDLKAFRTTVEEGYVPSQQECLTLLSEVECQRKKIEELEYIVGQLRDQQAKVKAQSAFAHREGKEV